MLSQRWVVCCGFEKAGENDRKSGGYIGFTITADTHAHVEIGHQSQEGPGKA